jgi:leader peptidase (prepilin peptidase)/N-methyltransferase
MLLVQLATRAAFAAAATGLAVVAVRGFVKPLPRLAIAMLGACAVLMVVTAMAVMPGAVLLGATLLLGWTLLVLAAIDAAILRLPDLFTLPLAALGLAVAWTLPGHPIGEHAAAAALGWLAFDALAWVFRRLRGHDAMGPGDAKLAGAAGAWLGLAALPSTVVLGCAAAFVWIALRGATQGRRVLTEPLPFGPPLALAIWIVWLYGSLPS